MQLYTLFAEIQSEVLRMRYFFRSNNSSRILVSCDDGSIRVVSPSDARIITTIYPTINTWKVDIIKKKVKYFYFTTIAARLEARMLAVDSIISNDVRFLATDLLWIMPSLTKLILVNSFG